MPDLTPEFLDDGKPLHPCIGVPTRHCPAVYGDVCGDRPCARFESDDEAVWMPEIRTAVSQ